MVNVNPIDGIKYGFRLMGYLVAVFVVGFLIMGIGVAIAEDDSAAVGGLIALVGFLTVFAGFAGVQYKIIADGVEKGVTAANAGTGGSSTGPSQSGGGQTRQPQPRQQGGRDGSRQQRGQRAEPRQQQDQRSNARQPAEGQRGRQQSRRPESQQHRRPESHQGGRSESHQKGDAQQRPQPDRDLDAGER